MNKIFSNRIVQAGLALSVVAASYFIYTTNTESSTMDNIETVSSAQENTEGLIIKTIPAVNMATEDIVVETVASPVASEKSSLKGKNCNPTSPSSENSDEAQDDGVDPKTLKGSSLNTTEDGC
jgi:hypothetical protein